VSASGGSDGAVPSAPGQVGQVRVWVYVKRRPTRWRRPGLGRARHRLCGLPSGAAGARASPRAWHRSFRPRPPRPRAPRLRLGRPRRATGPPWSGPPAGFSATSIASGASTSASPPSQGRGPVERHRDSVARRHERPCWRRCPPSPATRSSRRTRISSSGDDPRAVAARRRASKRAGVARPCRHYWPGTPPCR